DPENVELIWIVSFEEGNRHTHGPIITCGNVLCLAYLNRIVVVVSRISFRAVVIKKNEFLVALLMFEIREPRDIAELDEVSFRVVYAARILIAVRCPKECVTVVESVPEPNRVPLNQAEYLFVVYPVRCP